MNFLRRVWSDEKGEDMTEYALIVGLVALAAIVAMGVLGTGFQDWYTNLGTYVSTTLQPNI